MMKSLCHFLLVGILMMLTACQDPNKPKYTLSVHSEGSEMESPRSIVTDGVGTPPRKVILKRSPEFTQQNIAAFRSFPADNGNGFGVVLKLDFKGAQALELVTRMRQGELLRTVVNGRGVDWVRIDRPITDGMFTVWEGVPEDVVKDMGKRLPSLSGLRSASSVVDMTPTTKKEKKLALRDFKAGKREAANEKKKDSADELKPFQDEVSDLPPLVDPLNLEEPRQERPR